ncbi:RDD family protein [Sedimentitalea sp. XS_ASV28]|uniref:RDD family protein n=1 Tax=Sedimentitalea sp. XS_ASV28 TaxID=3241296 RepID=UPI0035110E80
MYNLPDPDRQPEFYASVPVKRLLAWIIDMLVILLLCLVGVLLTAFVGAFFFGFLWLILSFCYRVVTLANDSATWGMRFVGIEIRTADGNRLDLPMALAHTAGYTVSIALPLLQVISIVMMLTGARGQGLTDAFLGTVALNRRSELRA